MLRQKTEVEQHRFKSYFQNLNVHQALVTGDPSIAYNSIAWSVGCTSAWFWPGNNIGDFDAFYKHFGYVRAANGTIAIMGHDYNNLTHAALAVNHAGSRWESKCGADSRIQHGLNEFTGHTYGRVLAYYALDEHSENTFGTTHGDIKPNSIKYNYEELALIKEGVSRVPKKISIEFEKSFEVWRNCWFAGRLAVNSNPLARTNCYEFFKLVKMGEVILPLLVQKLTDKDNFLTLQLYNRLQTKPELLITHTLEDAYFASGEQGIAYRTVMQYLKHVQEKAISTP